MSLLIIYSFGPTDSNVIYLYFHTVLSLKMHTFLPPEILYVLQEQFKCNIVCKLNPGSLKPKCQNIFLYFLLCYLSNAGLY